MKKLLTTAIIALWCNLLGCTAQTLGFQSLDVETFQQRMANRSEVVVLDARTVEEYTEGHLADAANIDVLKGDFEQRALASLPSDKCIAVYCRSGRRSKKAAEILVRNGYKVIELDKGYTEWTRSGKAVTKEEMDVFTTPGGTVIRIYCIKHGSLRMSIGDKWLYVDPVTTAVRPTTDYTAMPRADFILITHEHSDHLDSVAIRQLTHEHTVLITNPRSSERLGGKGEVMRNGESKLLADGWQLTAVPAYNLSPEKQKFHPKGRDNGYVLTIDGLRIYLAGDTEEIPEMAALGEIDVAFLPCNLPYTMAPAQLLRAAGMIKPKVLFPYHYGQTDLRDVTIQLIGNGIDTRIRQYQ